MKLRNKKTAEIVEISNIGLVWNKYGMPADIGRYKSLAELNEEWEDYTQAEPLIKDEKIRKAVLAWADFNGIKEVTYFKEDFGIRLVYHTISIDLYVDIDELKNYKHYTIAELCGEEEE